VGNWWLIFQDSELVPSSRFRCCPFIIHPLTMGPSRNPVTSSINHPWCGVVSQKNGHLSVTYVHTETISSKKHNFHSEISESMKWKGISMSILTFTNELVTQQGVQVTPSRLQSVKGHGRAYGNHLLTTRYNIRVKVQILKCLYDVVWCGSLERAVSHTSKDSVC
jgi:hypothetical protein